ncbi:MAG: hypothetical protein MUC36_26180 [Planctomycetes bacterium]|jgi:hypothetical protein|nr:hypothetical protein [Planctomycetota bacterium]
MKTLLPCALLLSAIAAQSPSYDTFGSALSAQASFSQFGFSAAATCNGVSGGASWILGPNQYDGWALFGAYNVDNYIAWTFRGGSRVVSRMQLRSDYGFVAQYGALYVRHFAIDVTTDAVPSLGGNWTPVVLQQVLPAGATVAGNVVTYPVTGYPNLENCDVQFAPVAATGVRLRVFPQGGTNSNIVLTEVSFATVVPGLLGYGTDSSCAGARSLTVNGVPRLGDAGFAWQAPRAPVGGLGLLFASTAALPAAVPALGIGIWISPAGAVGLTTVASSWGTAETPFPLPNNAGLIGFQVAAQYVWLESCAAQGLTASSAGRITLQ